MDHGSIPVYIPHNVFLIDAEHSIYIGKDPIYRTKVIVRKPVWMPARPTQSHNTDRLETDV